MAQCVVQYSEVHGIIFLFKETHGMLSQGIMRFINVLKRNTLRFCKGKQNTNEIHQQRCWNVQHIASWSILLSDARKKKCKRNWAVVLGVWLDQPVVILTVVIEKSEKEVHESVPWRLGWTAAHWWTGGGGLYRRRDHLICSLADWRTCEWKVLLTKQFTAATKFVLYWPVAKWQQYRISHWG